jgi:hypothetical protein
VSRAPQQQREARKEQNTEEMRIKWGMSLDTVNAVWLIVF